MRRELGAGGSDPRAARVVAIFTARRAVRSAAVWGILFGLLTFNEAVNYHNNFPTSDSRESFARTLGSNKAIIAIIGPARHVDTLAGFLAWRLFFLMVVVGAIWGLLTATRLLRREEDAGRWELLLAGRTTRRHATGQVLTALAAGWAVMWALTALCTVAGGAKAGAGFAVSASLFYATAVTAAAAMFLAVGALASQLAATRRQASGLAALAFAVCYLIRMLGDSRDGLAWMRWISPLGWVENLSPLTGSRPLALAPILLLLATLSWATIRIAGRRDLGTASLAPVRTGQPGTRLLGSSSLLVVYLERWVALSWIAGLGLTAVVFGVTARAAAAGNVAVGSIEQQLGRLGAHPVGAVAAWIGYEFIYLAALLAVAAAGQISALRNEEADGHLDNLLARRLSRPTWLIGRLGFALALVLAGGLVMGIGGWLGVAFPHGAVGFGAMIQAGLNAAVPALFVLGLGSLLYGIAPRWAVPIVYVVILWSFLIEIVGTSVTGNHWLLDTALLSHLGPVPATGLAWSAIGWLTGLAVAATLAGLAVFNRRDLAAA